MALKLRHCHPMYYTCAVWHSGLKLLAYKLIHRRTFPDDLGVISPMKKRVVLTVQLNFAGYEKDN